MHRFQHWRAVAAWCSVAVAPPSVVVSGAGVDQIHPEGLAKLIDGVDTPVLAGKGLIDPLLLWIPPVLCDGWEGGDQASKEVPAELADGIATPVIAGEGAINPFWLPPVLCDGWKGGDRASKEVHAKPGDGVSAPVVAGEGAIDPSWFPPMIFVVDGREMLPAPCFASGAMTLCTLACPGGRPGPYQANSCDGHEIARGRTQGLPPPNTPAVSTRC